MNEATALILAEGLVDWISLADVVGFVGDVMPDAPHEVIRGTSLTLVEKLIRDGVVVVGDLHNGFRAWDSSADEAMLGIDARWTAPAGELDAGHGPWFELTAEGRARAAGTRTDAAVDTS